MKQQQKILTKRETENLNVHEFLNDSQEPLENKAQESGRRAGIITNMLIKSYPSYKGRKRRPGQLPECS
jgi:hypothetical protein